VAISAIAARLWTYHRIYDDLLILLPIIALARIAVRRPITGTSDVTAGILLAITGLAALVPRNLFLFPFPWKLIFGGAEALIWLGALAFFLSQARRESHEGVDPACHPARAPLPVLRLYERIARQRRVAAGSS
jgi:hypothetical protein